jgi:hypothetical protein
VWIAWGFALVFYVVGFALLTTTKWGLAVVGAGSVCLLAAIALRFRDLGPGRK